MEIVQEICKWIVIVLSVYSAPLMIWTLISALNGTRKLKERAPIEDKQHDFAVIICARNEENVLPNLLKSLQRQEYAGKHDVFVVADNCTDATASVAAKHGATVFVRNNDKEVGKGYALQYGIDKLMTDYSDKYDAICVFDADNLAASNFLSEMNATLCSGVEVAQGYRDTKNVHDSWLSETYTVYWLMLTRYYHAARANMGLSSMVGGTGFAFKTSCLENGKWNTHSLTEDVEFSIQQITRGNSITLAYKAVFYDEQPTTMTVSVKQRLRWIKGNIQCIPLCLPGIVKQVFKGNLKCLDLAWYLLFIPASGIALPLNVLTLLTLALNPTTVSFALPMFLLGAAAAYVVSAIVAYSTLRMEKKDLKAMRRAVLLYPFFILTTTMIAFVALIRPKMEWVPIKHESKYSIEEIEAGQ